MNKSFVLLESSLSSVTPPDIWYCLKLPQEVIDNCLLSALQLEAVTYACQQHETFLADGTRAGFLIGRKTMMLQGMHCFDVGVYGTYKIIIIVTDMLQVKVLTLQYYPHPTPHVSPPPNLFTPVFTCAFPMLTPSLKPST